MARQGPLGWLSDPPPTPRRARIQDAPFRFPLSILWICFRVQDGTAYVDGISGIRCPTLSAKEYQDEARGREPQAGAVRVASRSVSPAISGCRRAALGGLGSADGACTRSGILSWTCHPFYSGVRDREGIPATGWARGTPSETSCPECWDGYAAALPAGPVYSADAYRDRLASQGLGAVMPARARRPNCQFHGRERYLARHVVARGLGWLKHGRRVATRYVQRGLGFLCLVGTWSD